MRAAERAPRRAAWMLAPALLVAACSSGGDDATDTVPDATLPITGVPVATEPPTTPPPSTSTAPSTFAPDTIQVADTTTEPPTTPAPTTPAPTTTEPIAVQELVLTGNGVGSALFGAEPDGVIEYVTSILGGNTGDTGWVAPDSFAVCQGTEARRVDWGVLSLLFTDLSDFANGRRHFIGYEYGRVGQIGDEPVGLRTPGGMTLGSRVVDLLAEFPDATVNSGEAASGIPDNFYVSNVFYGLLTGVTDDDYVTVLFGGYGCGE